MCRMKKTLRVLNYAVNGIGLGHLSRLIAINRWVRRLAGAVGVSTEVLFLTSSEADTLVYHNDFAAFKIPSKTSVSASGLHPTRYRQLAKQWVWNSIGLYAPDIMLVDTFPNGSFQELGSIAEFTPKKVFVYRAVRSEQAQKQEFRAALRMYDCIIATCEETFFSQNSLGECEHLPEGLPSEVESRVRTTGEIMLREREELYSCSEARAILGLPAESLCCYLSAGGGGDANAEAVLERLVSVCREFPATRFVIGAGALYRGREFFAPNVQWSYRYNMIELMNAFDCAVSAGGYNTVHELLYASVPTAFFAQERLFDDQARRIQHLADARLCLALQTPSQDHIAQAVRTLHHAAERVMLRGNCDAAALRNHAPKAARYVLEQYLSEELLDHAELLLASGFWRVPPQSALAEHNDTQHNGTVTISEQERIKTIAGLDLLRQKKLYAEVDAAYCARLTAAVHEVASLAVEYHCSCAVVMRLVQHYLRLADNHEQSLGGDHASEIITTALKQTTQLLKLWNTRSVPVAESLRAFFAA
jgi:UDP-N-acetylglucosamine--N-acetylmuramyl-(pentapeptide) pyrophosphoryl-undecaprenol N-acetylglucosamine transferase